ncbi:HAD family hydrolase [Trypanosoma grayi]|uniref:HAD family hydrolase n=1 Tax=Trypanosoma grayi TaxID=71804 RepID=UPI0004F49E1B|nr:HAD family hydrolase [Trypanosoma grayi]KEG07819.1 HAD family hydrolase [Trypanosoma grayi]
MTRGFEEQEQQEQQQQLLVLLDVDNTLYCDNNGVGLAKQMRAALIEYVMDFLELSQEKANELVVHCFHTYGLTILGLVREKTGVDPARVMDHVYNRCDFGGLREDPALRKMLQRLCDDGRRHLFYVTNASRQHVTTVLRSLGLGLDGFSYEDQWACTAPSLSNKPAREAYSAIYAAVRERLQQPDWLVPRRVVMVDDSAYNLLEPLAMGWAAVWMSNGDALPAVLVEPMKTGRLFCIENIMELEGVIQRLAEEPASNI